MLKSCTHSAARCCGYKGLEILSWGHIYSHDVKTILVVQVFAWSVVLGECTNCCQGKNMWQNLPFPPSGPSCWCDLHHPASWEQERLLWLARLHHWGPRDPLCGSLQPNLSNCVPTEQIVAGFQMQFLYQSKMKSDFFSWHFKSQASNFLVSKIQLPSFDLKCTNGTLKTWCGEWLCFMSQIHPREQLVRSFIHHRTPNVGASYERAHHHCTETTLMLMMTSDLSSQDMMSAVSKS